MPPQTRRRGPRQGPSRVATTEQPLTGQGATPPAPRHAAWAGLAELERQRARAQRVRQLERSLQARRDAGDREGSALALAWLQAEWGAA